MNQLLGKRIEELRTAKNYTREQVANQIGISIDKYIRIESGNNSIPLSILSKVALITHILF